MTGLPRVSTDLAGGGRWTALRLGGRDWLWHRDEPARATAKPGNAFVDAGGLEECIPTVRGLPDHGAVWTRPWCAVDEHTAAVDTPDFQLWRRFQDSASGIEAAYRLTAEPGYRFVWAAHALLDLSTRARLVLPDGVAVRVFPEGADLLDRPWPPGASYAGVRPGRGGRRRRRDRAVDGHRRVAPVHHNVSRSAQRTATHTSAGVPRPTTDLGAVPRRGRRGSACAAGSDVPAGR